MRTLLGLPEMPLHRRSCNRILKELETFNLMGHQDLERNCFLEQK